MFSANVELTSILAGLWRGQRDERLDVVVRQSGEDSSANQPTCDNVNKKHFFITLFTCLFRLWDG